MEIIGYEYYDSNDQFIRVDYDLDKIIRNRSAKHAYYYARFVNNGKISDELEEVISSDPYYAYQYATNVIGGKASDIIEKGINKESYYTYKYDEFLRSLNR